MRGADQENGGTAVLDLLQVVVRTLYYSITCRILARQTIAVYMYLELLTAVCLVLHVDLLVATRRSRSSTQVLDLVLVLKQD